MDGAWQGYSQGYQESDLWSDFTLLSLLSGFGKGRVRECVSLRILLLKKRDEVSSVQSDEDLLLHFQIHSSLFFQGPNLEFHKLYFSFTSWLSTRFCQSRVQEGDSETRGEKELL